MGPKRQKRISNDCVEDFTADAVASVFSLTRCVKRKQQIKREPSLSKEEFTSTEMLCLCSKTDCCKDVASEKHKFSSRVFKEPVLEQSGDGPMESYRRVMKEIANFTSNNREFR